MIDFDEYFLSELQTKLLTRIAASPEMAIVVPRLASELHEANLKIAGLEDELNAVLDALIQRSLTAIEFVRLNYPKTLEAKQAELQKQADGESDGTS